nr:uncharacterized protein LOC111983048 [Quercus suber]
MADQEQKALRDYAMPSVNGATSNIRRLAIQANNFEIKPAIIQMIQDKAKVWLNSLPPGIITTWEELAQKFLAKYFLPAKTAKLRNDITTFIQFEGESLYESWERYKDLLRRCPHHDLPAWLQVQTFYNGLRATNRSMVDAAAGGALMSKTHEAAYELLEELASNNYQWPIERAIPRKATGVLELDSITSLAAQMATLSQQLSKMNVNAIQTNVVHDHCAGNHSSADCQVGNPFAQSSYEQANYVSNFQHQNNPYLNMYNPGWRNHPIFSWRNHQRQAKPPQQFPQQEKKPTLEDMFMQYMQKIDVAIQNNSASIRNLEVQIGQLSSMLTERTTGTLPSNTITNPKEHVKAISLRSGQTYEEPKVTNAKQDEAVDNEESKMKEAESETKEDIISKKRKLEEHETVMLTEESSAILQKKLPPKLKDPGSFTIPCTIGKSYFDRALCDLGASINLMPFSVFRKLGLGEVKPTTISLQLADRSIKYPRGVIEDILVKVDKFIFPADFIVLDMDEDEEIPLILG